MAPKDQKLGRPYSGSEKRSVTVRLRMEPAEAKDLDRLAERLDTTRSGVIREALKLLIERTDKRPT